MKCSGCIDLYNQVADLNELQFANRDKRKIHYSQKVIFMR
jgi:predicted anti-sigma-YlaC factor YlaD